MSAITRSSGRARRCSSSRSSKADEDPDARSEHVDMNPSRHCERSEAIQGSVTVALDCFVVEPVLGPAFGRTRGLLAMTVRVHLDMLRPRIQVLSRLRASG